MPVNHFFLIELKHFKKDGPALLPLGTSDDEDAFKKLTHGLGLIVVPEGPTPTEGEPGEPAQD